MAESSAKRTKTDGEAVVYRILALYRFVPLATPEEAESAALSALRTELLGALRRHDVKGTLLIAPEGINGTISYTYAPSASGDTDTATSSADLCDSPDESSTRPDDSVNKQSPSDPASNDDPVRTYLTTHPLFGGPELRVRFSQWTSTSPPFHRLKVKIKSEIVTLGLGRPMVHRTPRYDPNERVECNRLADPNSTKGTYLSPAEWDDACRDPDILVIDTRNRYEIDIGTFEGAIDPGTENFSDFPSYLEKLAGEYDWEDNSDAGTGRRANPRDDQSAVACKKKPPKGIAMFCTGGIRCEKATSFTLQSKLFPSELPIYHLEGGILAYLDDVAKRKHSEDGQDGSSEDRKENSSTFHGECFVFDKRVAVTDGLRPSSDYSSCHGCRGPIEKRLLDPSTRCTAGMSREAMERHDALVSGLEQSGLGKLPPLCHDAKSGGSYIPGLTCPRCHDNTNRDSLEKFAMRRLQVELCGRDGRCHFEDRGAAT